MLVDDNEVGRYALSRLLRREGFEVTEAATGQEALRLAATPPQPGLIILDVKLPDLSRFAGCQALKQQPATAHLPVLHVSAVYVQEADKVQGLESGADAYLTGPIEPSVLLATLQALLRVRHAEAALREVNATLEQQVVERTAALCHEITARTAAEAQVRQAHGQLRALLARLEALREAERTRLARDLHDDLGQQLTALHMDLTWLAQQLRAPVHPQTISALLERVVDALALVQTLSTSVHALAVDLRPSVLDRLGLGPALLEEARRFQTRTAIVTTVHLPDPELALTPDVATTLFRIFQECLTNVVRHAGASQVEVTLMVEAGGVMLRVQDNGRGIMDAEREQPAALGLLGMHERAALLGGEVHVAGAPGHGTVVTVRLPQHSRSEHP